MPTFFVTLPGRVRSQANARGHWSKRHRYSQAWRRTTALLVAEAMLGLRWEGHLVIDPATPKRITFTADVRSIMDSDNLQSALKGCRDGLQDAHLIDSDKPSAGHVFIYEQRIHRKVGEAVTILVETL